MATALLVVGLVAGFVMVVWVGAPGILLGLALPVSFASPILGQVGLIQLLIPFALLSELVRHAAATTKGGGNHVTGLRLGAAALVAWLFATAIWTVDPAATVRALLVLLTATLGLWALTLYTRRAGAHAAWTAWFVLGLFQAVAALLWYLSGRPAQFNLQSTTAPLLAVSEQLRLGHPFLGLSNYYASFCLLFLVPGVCGVGPIPLRRACLAANAFALMLTVSRGGLLAGSVGVAIALLLTVRRLRHAVTWILGGSTVAIAATFYLTSQRGLDTSQFLSDPGRSSLRALALDYIGQRPLAGAGYGSYVAFPGLQGGTHSYPLTVWLETGLVGIALLAWCSTFLFFRLLRISDQRSRAAAVSLFIAVGLNILFEASLEGVYFALQMLLLVGILLGIPTVAAKRSVPLGRVVRRPSVQRVV